MALFGRSSIGAFSLLLLGLFFMHRLDLALASTGGVMGGSFFQSDSSSSDSFTSDSETVTVLHDSPSPDDEDARGSHGGGTMLFVIFTFGLLVVGFCKNSNGNTITVLKLQVAMLGGIRSSIQRELTKIAEDADTSSLEGVIYLLTETIQRLHQHLGNCIAGYSCVDLKPSGEDGKKCYNQLSNEERAKFDEETLVNLNNKERISTRNQSVSMFSNEYKVMDVKKSKEEGQIFEEEKLLNGLGNEYIVITILVAVKGSHKFPNINGVEDLKKALQKLRSLLSSKLLAGEVLWTPQKEDDTLSEWELLKDYPQLAKGMKSFLVMKHMTKTKE